MKNNRHHHHHEKKHKAHKPPLDWSEQLVLAEKSSLAANACNHAFYEVSLREETTAWNSKKPPLIKLVPFSVTRDFLVELDQSSSSYFSISTESSTRPEKQELSPAAMMALPYLNRELSLLDQVREAHSLLRFGSGNETPLMTAHTAISHASNHGRRGRKDTNSEDAEREERERQELLVFQRQALEEIQRANKQFLPLDKATAAAEDRRTVAQTLLEEGVLTYRSSVAELDALQQAKKGLEWRLKRMRRNQESLQKRLLQQERLQAMEGYGQDMRNDWSPPPTAMSAEEDTDGLNTGGQATTHSDSTRTIFSPKSDLGSEEGARAELEQVRARILELQAHLSCFDEAVQMSLEDFAMASVEEGYLLQKLIGCLHKTNTINGSK